MRPRSIILGPAEEGSPVRLDPQAIVLLAKKRKRQPAKPARKRIALKLLET